jgi:CRISPR-associated protein Cas2
MDLLVTYDIATTTTQGQRRLHKVAKICEGYGVRVQYSVFECRLSNAAIEKLKTALLDIIDTTEDSIRIYQIHGDISNSRETLGSNRQWSADSHWIL